MTRSFQASALLQTSVLSVFALLPVVGLAQARGSRQQSPEIAVAEMQRSEVLQVIEGSPPSTEVGSAHKNVEPSSTSIAVASADGDDGVLFRQEIESAPIDLPIPAVESESFSVSSAD